MTGRTEFCVSVGVALVASMVLTCALRSCRGADEQPQRVRSLGGVGGTLEAQGGRRELPEGGGGE